MQIVMIPPGNMSYITQIRSWSARKHLNPEMEVDNMSDMCTSWTSFHFIKKKEKKEKKMRERTAYVSAREALDAENDTLSPVSNF